MDQFPPDIDHDPFFSDRNYSVSRFPRFDRNLFVRVADSCYGLSRRILILAGACHRENWSIRMLFRNNDHCPFERTQTPGHKTRSVSLWLSFRDSSGQFQPTKKTGPSGGRDAAASLSPSINVHIGANKRATAKYASSWPLTFSAKRVDYAPLRQFRNILKARIGIL